MKRTLITTIGLMTLVAAANAQYFIAGSMEGWSHSIAMTSNGDGTHTANLTGLTPGGRYEYKVTEGSWNGNDKPSANAWMFADANGNATLHFDTNTRNDGYTPTTNRIWGGAAPTTWTAVGNFQGWNNANAATAMTHVGGGIYRYETMLAPGTYELKATVTGSWDAIGSDGQNINAGNMSVTITDENPKLVLTADANLGLAKVEAVPEPGTMIALGAGLAALAARRRRK